MGTVKDLVVELAENMGLDNLSFGENDIVPIQFDDLILNIHADPESAEITLFLAIGNIPESPASRTTAYAYLLKTNNFALHTGGGILGVDETETAAYFSYRFAAGALTVQRLEKIVEAFLTMSDALIAEYRQTVAQADGEGAASPSAGMRV